jgi:hypothetical protein
MKFIGFRCFFQSFYENLSVDFVYVDMPLHNSLTCPPAGSILRRGEPTVDN